MLSCGEQSTCEWLGNYGNRAVKRTLCTWTRHGWTETSRMASVGKTQQPAAKLGVQTNVNSSNRLIILYAGSSTGFVPNAKLVFKAGCSSGDYHGQMNSTNFGKWLEEKLLPNLSHKSVIVIDNAPYHNKQQNKPPTLSSLKADIIQWLQQNEKDEDKNPNHEYQ